MAFIVQTIAGENQLELGAEEFVRKMDFGTNWYAIRIALRLCVNDSGGNIPAARLVIGVLQGSTYGFTSPNCVDFIGSQATGGVQTWQRYTVPTRYDASNGNSQGLKKVGAIETTVASSAGGTANFACPSTHGLWLVDITKGNPNYAVRLWTTNAAPDQTQYLYWQNIDNQFAPQSVSTLGIASVPYAGSGLFDTVSISWNKSSPTMLISDVYVIRYN